ncbi:MULTISPECIES: hypothetical protein [Brevibacterium]|uniref:DUF4315 family protein n=1 Tax=Brevibacterium salitolerans TaxID=1403566 RepID=A0ABN2X884_9MICO|nr:hypothetical protein [Brevibacterium sp.]
MSRFEDELDTRIAELRQRLAQARAEQDELREQELLTDLETLIDIAGRTDVDTKQMEAVLEAETGALPVIPDLSADPGESPTGVADEPEGFTSTD